MIVGTALAEWLANRDAQQLTSDAMDSSARKWARHPSLTELEAAVSAPGHKTPEALLAIARRYLDRSADIDELIRDMIAGARADPFFRPPFEALSNEIMQGLLLYHHANLLIALSVTRLDELAAKKAVKRRTGSINFAGHVTLMRFIDAGDALVTLWEAPRIGNEFAANEAASCRKVGQRRLADGDELVVDGRYQSFTIDHASRDMIYFQVVARAETAPVSVEYDSETKALMGASSTDEASSRIQLMVSLLRAMECQRAMPVLEASLGNPQFYTRWHVMREMLALNAEGSLPALKRMAEADPHPDIRLAAQQSLEMFFPEAERADAGDASCPA